MKISVKAITGAPWSNFVWTVRPVQNGLVARRRGRHRRRRVGRDRDRGTGLQLELPDCHYAIAGLQAGGDDGAPVDPEYDQSEELWKDGKYLDALNAMRDREEALIAGGKLPSVGLLASIRC